MYVFVYIYLFSNNFGILSVVVSCYSLVKFLLLFLGQCGNTAICLKKYHKNVWLLTLIFTKLPHNVCLINTHILIDRYAWCNCKLWKALWFLRLFYRIFVHIIVDHSYLKYCVITKLSQNICLIDTHYFVYWYTSCDCS